MLGIPQYAQRSHLLRSESMLVKMTRDDAQRYKDFLQQYKHRVTLNPPVYKPYGAMTIRRKLSGLRCFFKFCNRHGLMEVSPMDGIRLPKRPKFVPKFLTDQEVTVLLESPLTSTKSGARDRAILECLSSTGIRVSELVGLNVQDVDLNRFVIFVRRHGSTKGRLLPIGQTVIDAIMQYLEMRGIDPKMCGSLAGPLFLNKQCSRLSMRGVRRMLCKSCIKSGIGAAGISPQTFRNTCAARMLNRGESATTVKERLGFGNESSIKRYSMTGG